MQPQLVPPVSLQTLNTELHPFVEIILDRPRRIVFDFNALIVIEEMSGEKVEAMAQGQDAGKTWKPKMRELRTLVWAGLLYDDPSLTLEQVGRILPPGRLTEISTKVQECMALCFPKKEAATAGAAPLQEVAPEK